MDHHEIDIEGITSRCLDSVTRRLEGRKSGSEIIVQAQALPFTIFKVPEVLGKIDPKAVKPELVSLGPYHKVEERLFEEHKGFFLKSFLRRTDSKVESLIKLVAGQASSAWNCYSEPKMKLDEKFIEMMLLDGCFVVELLLQICAKIEDENNTGKFELIRTWSEQKIHRTIGDLLKLENQVPYSLLQSLFECSISTMIEVRTRCLFMLALRVFNLVYPGAKERRDKYTDLQYQDYVFIKREKYNHLLELFRFTLFPANTVPQSDPRAFRPSDKSIPCVTKLKPCGIKFKSKKTERFLDISFRKRVLEIPSIAVNDFMVTVLINCVALEQCQESSSKHITDYVSFMHCLINESKDVSLLCSEGIISTLAHDDQYVVNLFNDLVKGIVFNVNTCYLSKQFEELESYYYSCWGSMIRTYFSSPWAAISVFSAFLIIALTVTQAVFAVLGYYSR